MFFCLLKIVCIIFFVLLNRTGQPNHSILAIKRNWWMSDFVCAFSFQRQMSASEIIDFQRLSPGTYLQFHGHEGISKSIDCSGNICKLVGSGLCMPPGGAQRPASLFCCSRPHQPASSSHRCIFPPPLCCNRLSQSISHTQSPAPLLLPPPPHPTPSTTTPSPPFSIWKDHWVRIDGAEARLTGQ